MAPEGDGGDVGAGGEVLDDGFDIVLLIDAEGNVLAVRAPRAGEVEGEDGHAVGEGAIEEDGRFCAARAVAVEVDYCGQDGKSEWRQWRRRACWIGHVVGALELLAASVDELEVVAQYIDGTRGRGAENPLAEVAASVLGARRADDEGRQQVDALRRERTASVAHCWASPRRREPPRGKWPRRGWGGVTEGDRGVGAGLGTAAREGRGKCLAPRKMPRRLSLSPPIGEGGKVRSAGVSCSAQAMRLERVNK